MCSLPVRTTLFPYTTLFRSDEINRTPPKTQSALLEAMEERQVTVDGRTMPLPDPFMVIATQNPVEYERSEEHTSELQSRGHLVCRLLLENKKRENITHDEKR